jgi:Zn finger protein HypA/HybF involved in hydrogenase expression
MHELSLAMEICRMAEAHLGREAVPRLVEVGVEVGDDAGIEPDNLEFCLGVLLKEPPFRNAKVKLLRQSGDVLRLSYLEVEDGRPDD